MEIIRVASTGTPAKSEDLIEINDEEENGNVAKIPKSSSSHTPPSSVSNTLSIAGDFDTNLKAMNSIHDEVTKKRMQIQEERLQLDRERMEEEKRKTDLMFESFQSNREADKIKNDLMVQTMQSNRDQTMKMMDMMYKLVSKVIQDEKGGGKDDGKSDG